MIKKGRVAAIGIATIVFFIWWNSFLVKAFVSELQNDDIWSTFKVSGDKIVDWGIGVTYTNLKTSVERDYPAGIDTESRRTHDLDNTGYYTSTVKVTSDRRGWEYTGCKWYSSSDFYSNYSLVGEYETNGFNPFAAYGLHEGVNDGGSRVFNPPGYSAAPFRYRRFFIVDYERNKPVPIHGKTYVSLTDSAKYSDGNNLWVRPGNEISIRTYGYDKYPSEYGQNAQYEAMLRENLMEIQSTDGSTLFNRISNEKDGTVNTFGNNNGADILKSYGIYWRGYTNGNRDYVNGLYLNGIGSEMKIVPKNNQDLYIKTNHRNKYDEWTSEGWHYNFALGGGADQYELLRTDGDAPTIDDAYADNISIDGFNVVVDGITDNGRSGVNKIQLKVWTNSNGTDDVKTYECKDSYGYLDYHIDRKNHNGEYGKYTIEIYTVDNLGNRVCRKTITATIPDPKPTNGKLEVRSYDYNSYEDPDVYWVKPNTVFNIYTDGYFPSEYNIFPERTYVLFAKDNVLDLSNSSREWADINGKQKSGSEFDSYFNFICSYPYSNEDKAKIYSEYGNNYISHVHKLSAKNDGTAFRLYFTNTYFSNGVEYYNGYKDSGEWLKVDGRAPTGNPVVELDYTNLDMDIRVDNVTDNGGSGVKRVWAEVYPTNNTNNKKVFDLDDSDKKGQYTLYRFNAYELFQKNTSEDADSVMVDIYLEDNVGNKSRIQTKKYDLFTVEASVVPYNNQQYVPASGEKTTLQKGQSAILKIKTTGAPQELQIDFGALNEIDGSLNRTISISPEKYLETAYEFYVPLYCDEKTYNIAVKALKYDRFRETNVEFNVAKSVLGGIKTRVR